MFRSRLVTDTAASGTLAPVESVIWPEMLARNSWAKTEPVRNTTESNHAQRGIIPSYKYWKSFGEVISNERPRQGPFLAAPHHRQDELPLLRGVACNYDDHE